MKVVDETYMSFVRKGTCKETQLPRTYFNTQVIPAS
jgi:hypothetical protein